MKKFFSNLCKKIKDLFVNVWEEADELTKAANLQLQQSETGIAEYIQSITTAREIRRGYIETVYQYNIAALEYELFK